MRTIAGLLSVTALIGFGAGLASAQDKSNRYSLSPAEGGGYVRLDNQTGEMSLCRLRGEQWVCQDMADRGGGLGDEIERLRKENKDLKGEIRRMEDLALSSPDRDRQGERDRHAAPLPPARGESLPEPGPMPERRAERPGRDGGKFQLPSEQDVDQAMTYIQRMLRKFREKVKEFERENGTPL